MPSPKPPKTLLPEDFEHNQAWLVFRINQAPIQVPDQEFDIYVLQDAASMLVFGQVFATHGEDEFIANEVVQLMNLAHSKAQEWPNELILPGVPRANNPFVALARHHKISVRSVSESELSFYIKDVQEGFEAFFSSKS
jgi:hypothetical protein